MPKTRETEVRTAQTLPAQPISAEVLAEKYAKGELAQKVV